MTPHRRCERQIGFTRYHARRVTVLSKDERKGVGRKEGEKCHRQPNRPSFLLSLSLALSLSLSWPETHTHTKTHTSTVSLSLSLSLLASLSRPIAPSLSVSLSTLDWIGLVHAPNVRERGEREQGGENDGDQILRWVHLHTLTDKQTTAAVMPWMKVYGRSEYSTVPSAIC